MRILNGIKTRKMSEELEVFEKVGKFEVYEPNEAIWHEITELFFKADQDKTEDGQYISSFSKEATIQLFRLLTNIDMTEKMYDTYATKRNARLMLVQQYVIEVIQTYLKLGMASIENEKLSQDLGIIDPKNRNDKNVTLEQIGQHEMEGKEEQGIAADVITEGYIVTEADHITKKIEDMTNEELDIELARLEKIERIKALKEKVGE